jgi:hypothetical protein
LLERRVDELRRGATLVGPHREDLTLELNGVDLATYVPRPAAPGINRPQAGEVDLMREASANRRCCCCSTTSSPSSTAATATSSWRKQSPPAPLLVSSTDPDLLRAPVLAALPMASVGDGDVRVVDDGTGAAEQPD